MFSHEHFQIYCEYTSVKATKYAVDFRCCRAATLVPILLIQAFL